MRAMQNRGAARTIGLVVVAILVAALLLYLSLRELRKSPTPTIPPLTTSPANV